VIGFVGAASRSYYADLLNAGVKIYEYEDGLLHTKSLTLDAEVTLIGSANMDRRSFELNENKSSSTIPHSPVPCVSASKNTLRGRIG
jgi:cardiolipin synthase